jgi:uncharacterized Fe-S cluster-containing radical SAM superfamily protein
MEAPMAAKETSAFGFDNTHFTQATETMKEFMGWQWKANQALLDHGIKFSQAWTDFMYQQFNEGSRLTQEAMKTAASVNDESRKSYQQYAEKTFKAS